MKDLDSKLLFLVTLANNPDNLKAVVINVNEWLNKNHYLIYGKVFLQIPYLWHLKLLKTASYLRKLNNFTFKAFIRL